MAPVGDRTVMAVWARGPEMTPSSTTISPSVIGAAPVPSMIVAPTITLVASAWGVVGTRTCETNMSISTLLVGLPRISTDRIGRRGTGPARTNGTVERADATV